MPLQIGEHSTADGKSCSATRQWRSACKLAGLPACSPSGAWSGVGHEETVCHAAPEGATFPRELVACAAWLYYRFALSTADVEDPPAARGVMVS